MNSDESQVLPWRTWNTIALFDNVDALTIWEKIFSLDKVVDSNKRNLLHTLCHFKANDCIRYVAEKYPHLITASDVVGELPLHRACYGRATIAAIEPVLLPELINSPTWFGATPLHYAAKQAPRDVLMFLESQGADWFLPCKTGETPSDFLPTPVH